MGKVIEGLAMALCLEEAYERGRKDERADVVRFLEKRGAPWSDSIKHSRHVKPTKESP